MKVNTGNVDKKSYLNSLKYGFFLVTLCYLCQALQRPAQITQKVPILKKVCK